MTEFSGICLFKKKTMMEQINIENVIKTLKITHKKFLFQDSSMSFNIFLKSSWFLDLVGSFKTSAFFTINTKNHSPKTSACFPLGAG